MSVLKSPTRPRSVPQRTCVSCSATTAKRELIRLVRTAEGTAEPDETGKRAGRGAYLCRKLDCWQAALRKDRLGHAIKTKLSADNRARLLAYAEQRLTNGGA